MRILLYSAVAVASIAFCGCGGSKSSTATTTASTTATNKVAHTVSTASGPPLSSAKLVKRADAICARSNAKIAHIPGKVEKAIDYATIGLPRAAIYSAAVAELERLTPPSSLAAAWQQLLESRRALASTLETLGTDARAGDIAAMRVIVKTGGHIVPQIAASATKVGATQCAKIT